MRRFTVLSIALLAAALWGCGDDNPMSSSGDSGMDGSAPPAGKLTVSNSVAATAERPNGIYGTGPRAFAITIENASPNYPFRASGVFNTPVGDAGPGPLFPGGAYEFSFAAGPGTSLSFATMYVQSNDLFYAPDGSGLELFDASGAPISGDVTDQIMLWDAGTEVNEEPGVGTNQAPRQSGADTGADENGPVQLVDDGFAYPAVDEVIAVTISSEPIDGAARFIVRIDNVATGATPLAPGVFVVSTTDGPLFTAGQADRGDGLEALAEDGNPASLIEALRADTGVPAILAPGAWAVHSRTSPFFADGEMDRGDGLEGLAEDGDPSGLAAAAATRAGVVSTGVFSTPVGADGPGPLLPGGSYQFTVTAKAYQRLSFATMYVQSNDLFYAPMGGGVALFQGLRPVYGNFSDQVYLWDAGTEVNQAPGYGPDQAPRQSGPDTGSDEGGQVQMVDDGFFYPMVGHDIRVTITNR